MEDAEEDAQGSDFAENGTAQKQSKIPNKTLKFNAKKIKKKNAQQPESKDGEEDSDQVKVSDVFL